MTCEEMTEAVTGPSRKISKVASCMTAEQCGKMGQDRGDWNNGSDKVRRLKKDGKLKALFALVSRLADTLVWKLKQGPQLEESNTYMCLGSTMLAASIG